MNEISILELFYDEMNARGITRDAFTLTLEEDAAEALSEKLGVVVQVEQVQRLADICIANEWLERTTADIRYKYLSLTEAGLQIVLANKYVP